MKLNLKAWKKVNSDKNSTVLMNEQGHQLRINHKALSPKMRDQLGELETHKADGGSVDKSPYTDPKGASEVEKGATESGWQPKQWLDNVKHAFDKEPDPTPSPQKQYADGGDVSQDAPSAQPDAQQSAAPVTINIAAPGAQPAIPEALANPNPGSQAMAQNPPVGNAPPQPEDVPYGTAPANMDQAKPQAANPAAAPQQQPPAPVQQSAAQTDPYGTEAYGKSYEKGINEQKAGIMGQAQALGQQGQQESATLGQAVKNQQNAISDYKQHFADLDQERKSFQQDVMNSHIDPKRYMSSMGTGAKISTAIGMILGGFGAAAGQENAAISMLNRNIDRDIDAQKAEMSKKENLLSANMRQFGNLKDATDMTRVMSADMVSNQLKQAAAKAMSPMAKAQALQTAGKLDMESAATLSQIAMRKSILGGMQNGTVDPARVVNMLIPQDQRTEANKELKEAQQMSSARDNLLGSFDKLKEINTLGNSLTSPLQTAKQVAAIRDPLIAQLSKDTAGRFTEQDAKFVGSLFPAKGDNEETLASKRSQMIKLVQEKMHFPILKTYGIDAANMGRFNGGGAGRIQESTPVVK